MRILFPERSIEHNRVSVAIKLKSLHELRNVYGLTDLWLPWIR